jgi:hypothetical protein
VEQNFDRAEQARRAVEKVEVVEGQVERLLREWSDATKEDTHDVLGFGLRVTARVQSLLCPAADPRAHLLECAEDQPEELTRVLVLVGEAQVNDRDLREGAGVAKRVREKRGLSVARSRDHTDDALGKEMQQALEPGTAQQVAVAGECALG